MRVKDLVSARVGILGTGREGQAVWRYLRRHFPTRELSLFAEQAGNGEFIKSLNPDIDKYQPGPFEVDCLNQFDVLVRSAGISPYRPELQQLRSLGVRFTTACNLWFADHPDAKTICITGTKGKSTTATLIAHLLAAAGIKVCLAGNIGRPMLACDDSGGVDWWVIELSSYQIADLEAEPDIAVMLNISDEHVDWHGGSERYRVDKLKLGELARKGRLIANFADPVLVDHLVDHPDVTWFNHDDKWHANNGGVSSENNPYVAAPASLPGAHNLHNLAAALTVVDLLNVQVPDLEQALSTFSGLPHRLQVLGEISGVRYIDDSISTTPVSVLAALQTFGYENVVLLLGGMERGLDWDGFSKRLATRAPHAIITLPDNGKKILESLEKAGVNPEGGLHAVERLSQAVDLARALVPGNGCILLSPGAPSFPHFIDFEDRGRQFATLAGFSVG